MRRERARAARKAALALAAAEAGALGDMIASARELDAVAAASVAIIAARRAAAVAAADATAAAELEAEHSEREQRIRRSPGGVAADALAAATAADAAERFRIAHTPIGRALDAIARRLAARGTAVELASCATATALGVCAVEATASEALATSVLVWGLPPAAGLLRSVLAAALVAHAWRRASQHPRRVEARTRGLPPLRWGAMPAGRSQLPLRWKLRDKLLRELEHRHRCELAASSQREREVAASRRLVRRGGRRQLRRPTPGRSNATSACCGASRQTHRRPRRCRRCVRYVTGTQQRVLKQGWVSGRDRRWSVRPFARHCPLLSA